jgi:hypothetical protein
MKQYLFVAAVVATASGRAAADDPKFQYEKKADELKDVKGPEWFAAAEAGAIFTSGNSHTTSMAGGVKAVRKDGDNKLALEASGAYVKTGVRVLNDLNGNGMIDNSSEIINSETVTAETLSSKLRYDRFLTDLNSVYIAALANRDVPAGKLSVFGGQVGYSRQLYKSKEVESVAEVGYDLSREHLATGSTVAIHSARAFLGHHAVLAPGTMFDGSVEVLTNLNHLTLPTHQDGSAFEDTRVNVKLAVSAKLGDNLAIQTSVEAHYDHRPGPLAIKMLAPGFVPAAEPLDTIMKASLIYTFAGHEPAKK